MKKKLLLFPVFLLVISLLLQACAPVFVGDRTGDFLGDLFGTGENTPTTTDPTEETPTGTQTDPSPNHPSYLEYERRYEPRLDEISINEMEYTRPDAQAICDSLNAVTALVESGANLQEILSAFDAVYGDYIFFDTMSTLAYIRYTLDLNDSYYDMEYQWLEEQAPLIQQAAEKCYIAMGNSPLRGDLEAEYFYEGFFTYYDENQIFSNDRVVELMQEEATLQVQYMALQSDVTIEWNGEEVLFGEIVSDPDIDSNDMRNIYRLYYEKYAPLAADIFAQMIRVRREIAQELDYDSYADFAYEFYYDRDYTPAQAAQYTAAVAEALGPLYYSTYASSGISFPASTEKVLEALKETAYSFGGVIATAYDYMLAYDLYDLTESTSKMPGSYMTYLSSYEMPFLYVSPTGTMNDFLTASHEFGHFVDGYYNCNETTAIDCAEIFSQALEFLSLDSPALSDNEKENLTASKITEAILIFIFQACYTEFELRAYALPDEQLNAEGLSALFIECQEEFGIDCTGIEDIYGPGWIDVQHFFIAPMYVISYCISNDAALQVYQLELTDGSGMETYYALLDESSNNTILALLDAAGMESPFAEGRMAELAEFFQSYLN